MGRTDLAGADRTDELTRAQYQSVRRLAAELDASVTVHPTHGFGSFCSATPVSRDHSTIGEQRQANLAVRTDDEDAFVAELLAYPAYYAHMAAANAAGPAAPDLSAPEPVDPGELRRRVDAREWSWTFGSAVRSPARTCKGPSRSSSATPLRHFSGGTMAWGAPLTLVGDCPDQLLDARRRLSRIGVDQIRGGANGTTEQLALGRCGSYPVANFGTSPPEARRRRGPRRSPTRRVAAGHLEGAVHIPFWELEGRVSEVPEGELWVHCASGFRASISASILARAGGRSS